MLNQFKKGDKLSSYTIRVPKKEDGKHIFKLIKDGGVLDLNSQYLYLLQTTHFQNTCCVIEDQNNIIGFVSGYYLPKDSKKLFIWQVAVKKEYRGQNLAFLMINDIVKREDINYILSTVSPSNNSSKRVFEKCANYYNTKIEKSTLFSLEDFISSHEEEIQFKIGPINKEKK